MVKCFYILICITIFKLCLCERREALGNESILGKNFLVYFVKSPYSKADDDSWMCAGSIVSPTQILTAAYCIVEMERIYVIAGYNKYIRGHDIDKDKCTNMTKQRVVKIVVPKEYQFSYEKRKTWMNLDIGVAIVEKPYSFPDQTYRVYCSYEPQIVEINFDKTNEMEKTRVVEVGWGGQLSTSSPQDKKSQPHQEVTTTIIQKKYCAGFAPNEELQKLVDKYFLCVSDNSFLEEDDLEFKSNDDVERCSNRTNQTKVSDDSCFEDDFDFRRRNTNVNDTDQHDGNIKINNTDSELCHYEYGGPLVRRIVEQELVVGIALNSISNQNSNQCNGPHLYISTAKAENIIKCLLETNATGRKLCNDQIDDKRFGVNEIEIKWPSNTYSSKETSQIIPAYQRQGNEEEPLHMRPTKDLEKLKDVQGKPAQFGKPDSAKYEPEVDQKRSRSYYQPQEQLQDQMQSQFNNQYKDQSQGQQQQQPYYPYDQPREESNVHSYKSLQEDSYRQPVDPYNQPQIDSYNQPQIDSYNQPQIDSYNEPQIDPYDQPQVDPYNQPQIDPYNQPQIYSYNQQQKDPYNQPQLDPYNQPQVDPYNQPQVDPYNQPQVDPYNQPQVDSYNQPQVDPYNQPQADPYRSHQVESYNQPQVPLNNQPEVKSYNQQKIQSYNQPQTNSYNRPQVESYNLPQIESYNQPQVESYHQPQIESYNEPQVETYNQPTIDAKHQPQPAMYKPPQIESYKQTERESNNQKQMDSFKLPEIDSYNPPQSQSQFNQPQIDPYNKSETGSLQSHIPQLESYQQPQFPSYKIPEKMKAPSVELYNPLEILSGKQQVDTFKIPIIKPHKPSPMELYRQLFKPIPVESLRQPQLHQFEQISLTQNGQTAEVAHNPSPAQQVDFIQNMLREEQSNPTSDSPTPEPQIFEQLYSQINSPVISPPAVPVSEQTFEEVYKNLHDPSFDIPYGQETEERRDHTVEYRFEQPIDQMPKLSEGPEKLEIQPSEKNQDEVKVRPQVPLVYQDYSSYRRKSETI